MGRRWLLPPTTSRRCSRSCSVPRLAAQARNLVRRIPMLKRVDRVQIAVADTAAAERSAAEVLGAELVRRDEAAPLRARRTTMQAGSSLLELLEPDGAGPVRDFIEAWGGGGLFAAGFSVDDLDAAASHLERMDGRFERA